MNDMHSSPLFFAAPIVSIPHGSEQTHPVLLHTSYRVFVAVSMPLLSPNTVLYVQESEMETEEEVDILMSSDVYSATLSTKSITFSRAQTGWLFREDKTVGVGCCAAVVVVVVVIAMLLLPPPLPQLFQSQLWVTGFHLDVELLESAVARPRQKVGNLINSVEKAGNGR